VWLSTVMDTNGQNAAMMTIASNADTALAPITLAREIQYPAVWHLTISAPDSAYPGQPVTYKLLQHGTLPNDDTAIDFVLHYDGDLLTFQSVEEPNARGAGFQPALHGMTLHIAPVPADSVVATLHFTAFLAPRQHTTLSVDSIAFSSQPARPSDCIALAQVDTSGFTIRTVCGATELSQELNNLPIIVSQADVVDGTLHFTIQHNALPSVFASAELTDVLGVPRATRLISLDARDSKIDWSLAGLHSGAYFLRVTSNGFAAMRRLLIVE
jgi:hypothetical protein